MENGLVKATEEGTPQGGPLSPLLSNIMLDDFDKELEKRGLTVCKIRGRLQYLCEIGESRKRVMESVSNFLTTKLKLKVNQQRAQ